MSLLLWLPFNGELKNRGFQDKTITNNGTTFADTGLFNKSLLLNGTSNYLKLNNRIFANGDTEGTIMCWYNTTNASATQGIYCCRSSVGGGVTVFIEGGKIRLDTGSNAHTTFNSYNIVANEWTHIVCVFSKTYKKLYINGDLIQTVTGTFAVSTTSTDSETVGCSSVNGTRNYANYFTGQLNDLRVYDEVLSPTQIKEISKGLFCHYKLDGKSLTLGNPNYAYNLTSTNYIAFSAKTRGHTNEIITENNNDNVYKCTITSASNITSGWKYFHISYLESELKANTTYTISLDFKSSKKFFNNVSLQKTNASSRISNTAYFNEYTPNPNKYIRLYATLTTTDDVTPASRVIYIGVSTTNLEDGDTFYVKNVKLEEGSSYTGWTPQYNSTEYTTLLSDKEIDVSGYGNDGTYSSTAPATVTDIGGIYDTSLSLIGTNQNFITTPKACKLTNSITVSIWAKPSSFTGSMRIFSCTETGGWEIYNDPLRFIVYLRIKNAYAHAISTISASSLNDSWHMFTGTFNGYDTILYIDGEQVAKTSVTTKDTIKYNANNTIFLAAEAGSNTTTPVNGGYFTGYLSDFRIYATALSADDVKELYNTRFKMDIENNLLINGEVIEDDKISLNKNGVLNANINEMFDVGNDLLVQDGKLFTRIYHQKSNNGTTLFTTLDECLDNDEEDKYSKLKYMEYFCDKDGKYEFILKYPTLDSSKYNHWTQTSNPIITYKNNTTGYTGIHIDWSSPRFGGIGLQSSTSSLSSCYLSCEVGSTGWWFAIATVRNFNGGIPGPNSDVVQEVDLYVRIDNIDIDKIRYLENKTVIANTIIEY